MKGQPSHSHSIHAAIFNIELIGHHTSHLKAVISQYLITRFNNRPRRTSPLPGAGRVMARQAA